MNEFVKKIAYWMIPQGFQKIFFDIKSIQLVRDVHCNQNIKLKDIHHNERCFILATGPSIKNQDLKLLNGENCIAVSNFFVHPDYSIIKPKYYCVAPFHAPITEEAWQKWMSGLENGTGNSMMFFSLSDQVRNQKYFVNREVNFLNFGGSMDSIIHRGIDISRKIPGPQSVTIMALYVALYMGFKEIYLLGCDHDWILHLNQSSHFYSEGNHILNKSGYNEWFVSDVDEYFRDYLELWRQYKIINHIAKKESIAIYNATNGGLLDVFPRIKYESLFG